MIDNRGGGASQVGTQAIATAPADGYTIGLIDSAFTINPGLFAGKLPYDTLKDFAPSRWSRPRRWCSWRIPRSR